MNLQGKIHSISSSRIRWALLAVVLVVGFTLGFLLAPARAHHKPGHEPMELDERVELGDPGKHGALFVFCDGGYRVYVATTPNGNPSVFAVLGAQQVDCTGPPHVINP